MWDSDDDVQTTQWHLSKARSVLGVVHPPIILSLERLQQDHGELEASKSHMRDSAVPKGQNETTVTMNNSVGVALGWVDTERTLERISETQCSQRQGT